MSARRHRVHRVGVVRPARGPELRVRAARSRRSVRGRRSPSRTWRWTARGRSTRGGPSCRRATSTSCSCTATGACRPASPGRYLPLQLDPYTLTPLGLDPGALAALQARQLIDRGIATERDFAEVVARDRANAAGNPNAQVSGTFDVDALLAEPVRARAVAAPRLSPISDGAAAVVLAAGDKAAPARRTAPRGSPASTTASTSTSPGCATSPSRRRPRSRRRRPASVTGRSRWPRSPRRSARRTSSCAARSASTTRSR